MERIFYRKTTSILFVTAILVLVILACILLVFLTQLASLNGRVAILNEKIHQAQQDQAYMQELLEYMDSNDYVRKWAEANGRISAEDVQWLEEHTK